MGNAELENSFKQLISYHKAKEIIDRKGAFTIVSLTSLMYELKIDIDFIDPLWGAYNSGDTKTSNA